MIKAIKFANVPVSDQDRALEFYTKKLGFRVVSDSPFDDRQRWIELGIPRAETRLVLFTAPGQEALIGSFMNLAFAAKDVEATAKELKATARRSSSIRTRTTTGASRRADPEPRSRAE